MISAFMSLAGEEHMEDWSNKTAPCNTTWQVAFQINKHRQSQQGWSAESQFALRVITVTAMQVD